MEILTKPLENRKTFSLVEEIYTSKEKIVKLIGRDFNKSVCNMIGLIDLLKDEDPASEDFKNIQKYLSKEASKLHTLVENVCQ